MTSVTSFSLRCLGSLFLSLLCGTYCNEGIAKYKKILNMIGELSTIKIFRICPRLVNYSTSMQIILRHILLVNLAARWGDIFDTNSLVLKIENRFRKIIDEFKFGIHILQKRQ